MVSKSRKIVAQFILSGCAAICCSVSPFALHAQAVAEALPAPTGPFKTGRISFAWKDNQREEFESKATGDKRELMVHFFYPRDDARTSERAVYLPDADLLRGEWSDAILTRIKSMRSFSHENAALARGTARYPIAIFSPGVGIKALMYQALIEDLASYGWVVVAIDVPFSAPARFPDGRVLGKVSADEKKWPPGYPFSDEEYAERTLYWSRDVSFVIDQLTALDGGNGPFAHRLDLQHVGVFGHSFGGTAAAKVRLIDSRVVAAINVDGVMFERLNVGGPQPVMWILRRQEGRGRGWYLDRAPRALAGPGLRVILNRPGFTHGDYIDEPFWEGPMTPAARTVKRKGISDVREWVKAFFDATVRDDWIGLKRLSSRTTTAKPATVTAFGDFWRSSASRAAK